MTTRRFTIGGMEPYRDALEKYGRDLGLAFQDLTSADPATRGQGYNSMMALRRFFTIEQWGEYALALDARRSAAGQETFTSIMNKVGKEVFRLDDNADTPHRLNKLLEKEGLMDLAKVTLADLADAIAEAVCARMGSISTGSPEEAKQPEQPAEEKKQSTGKKTAKSGKAEKAEKAEKAAPAKDDSLDGLMEDSEVVQEELLPDEETKLPSAEELLKDVRKLMLGIQADKGQDEGKKTIIKAMKKSGITKLSAVADNAEVLAVYLSNLREVVE